MGKIRLLARADDAGLNRTINRAIRAAVKQGIVRNVSLLATGPSIEDAAEVLGDLGELTDFGLHVCLTSEWHEPRFRPLGGDASSMVRSDGTFPATVEELAATHPSAKSIEREVEAQLERLKSLGFEVRYLDEHMLVGAVDGVAEVLTSLAARHGLVCDRSIRESRLLLPLPGWNAPGPHPGTELADQLSGTGSGTYLVVGHPGFKADEMQRLRHESGVDTDVLQERNRQRRMFTDIEIVDYCENAGIELVRYRSFDGAK